MDNMQISNLDLDRVGWGLLAILWGVTILFDFVPFGAGLVGTGLIMLGIAFAANHLSMKNGNVVFALLILAWGGLEFARPLLSQIFPASDLDWVIFAILLIGLGVLLATNWSRPDSKKESNP
jgi:hypothetical protein